MKLASSVMMAQTRIQMYVPRRTNRPFFLRLTMTNNIHLQATHLETCRVSELCQLYAASLRYEQIVFIKLKGDMTCACQVWQSPMLMNALMIWCFLSEPQRICNSCRPLQSSTVREGSEFMTMHMIVGGCEDEGCLRLMHLAYASLSGFLGITFCGTRNQDFGGSTTKILVPLTINPITTTTTTKKQHPTFQTNFWNPTTLTYTIKSSFLSLDRPERALSFDTQLGCGIRICDVAFGSSDFKWSK